MDKALRPLASAKFLEEAKAASVIWARVKGYPAWPVSAPQEQGGPTGGPTRKCCCGLGSPVVWGGARNHRGGARRQGAAIQGEGGASGPWPSWCLRAGAAQMWRRRLRRGYMPAASRGAEGASPATSLAWMTRPTGNRAPPARASGAVCASVCWRPPPMRSDGRQPRPGVDRRTQLGSWGALRLGPTSSPRPLSRTLALLPTGPSPERCRRQQEAWQGASPQGQRHPRHLLWHAGAGMGGGP